MKQNSLRTGCILNLLGRLAPGPLWSLLWLRRSRDVGSLPYGAVPSYLLIVVNVLVEFSAKAKYDVIQM